MPPLQRGQPRPERVERRARRALKPARLPANQRWFRYNHHVRLGLRTDAGSVVVEVVAEQDIVCGVVVALEEFLARR